MLCVLTLVTSTYFTLNLTMWSPIGLQTKIHYLHLPKSNRLFVFTLYIILDIIYLTYYMNENQKSATPVPLSNFSVIYAKKCPSEPNQQDIQYPITSLIFVLESQSLCFCTCFLQGQGRQFLHLFCN